MARESYYWSPERRRHLRIARRDSRNGETVSQAERTEKETSDPAGAGKTESEAPKTVLNPEVSLDFNQDQLPWYERAGSWISGGTKEAILWAKRKTGETLQWVGSKTLDGAKRVGQKGLDTVKGLLNSRGGFWATVGLTALLAMFDVSGFGSFVGSWIPEIGSFAHDHVLIPTLQWAFGPVSWSHGAAVIAFIASIYTRPWQYLNGWFKKK